MINENDDRQLRLEELPNGFGRHVCRSFGQYLRALQRELGGRPEIRTARQRRDERDLAKRVWHGETDCRPMAYRAVPGPPVNPEV